MKKSARLLVAFITFLIGGIVLFNFPVSAARLSSMSDTLSSHAINGFSNHTLSFRSASGVAANATIRLFLADATADLGSITSDDIDIEIAGTNVGVAASATTNTWGVATTPATRLITLTAPSSTNLVSAGQTVVIRIGTHATSAGTGTRQMRNSASSGSKFISILSSTDVGLLSVRIGVQDSSGANITPTIDVSGSAPAPPTTAAAPAPPPPPPPAPEPIKTIQPVTAPESAKTIIEPAPVAPVKTIQPAPAPESPKTAEPTATVTSPAPKAEPLPPAPAPAALPAPEEKKTITTTQAKEPAAAPKEQSAPAPAPAQESKPVSVEPVFIPVTSIETVAAAKPSSTKETEETGTIPQPVSPPPIKFDGGVMISAPKVELPLVLPPDAIVEKLAVPVTQQLVFSVPSVAVPPPRPAAGGEINIPTPVFVPPPVAITYETGSGGSVEALMTLAAVPDAGRGSGVEAQISAQPLQTAQFWLGIQIPGPQLADKQVIGNKAYFISAERLNPETLADTSISDLNERISVNFCFTEKELEGIDISSLKVYSYDPIDGIRAENTSYSASSRCAIAKIDHLSAFVALGNLLPGATPSKIYVLPTEELTKIETEVKTEIFKLEDVKTGEAIEFFEQKIYSTPDTDISLCIPARTFKKPVKKMSLFLADKKYPLTYDRARDCYALSLKMPSQKGKQKVTLKIVYTDDQVQVIELETVITGALQAKLLPRVQKVAKQVQVVAVIANETVKETVETTQPVLQTTAVTAAPIVTIANPSVSANVMNWYHYLNHLISSLLSLFGLRKKRTPWGVVYDAITKIPLDLAIVRLFAQTTKKLIDTQVTDKQGRFSFIAPPGEYYIETRKPPLVFPSKIVAGKNDGDYANVYHQEPFTISQPEQAIAVNIPLDPLNPKEKEKQKISIVNTSKLFFVKYSKGTLVLSLTISTLLAVYTPSAINTILLGLNFAYALFQILLMVKVEKPWGIVFDAINFEPIPLAAISIFDAAQKKLLRSRLTDYVGRFNFLTPAGEYLMTVAKDQYAFPSSKQVKSRKFKNVYYGGNVKVKKNKAIVKINIPLQPVQGASPKKNGEGR